jgi:hypothetical protein
VIKVVRQHGILPAYLDEGLTDFISMMKTGLPKVRDNAGGHGSAPEVPDVATQLATTRSTWRRPTSVSSLRRTRHRNSGPARDVRRGSFGSPNSKGKIVKQRQ